MNKITIKSMVVVALISFTTTGAQAQSFLKKAAKAATKVTESVISTAGKAEQNESTTINKEELLQPMTFEVKKVIETNETGEVLKNDDGTDKYYYLVIDQDGKVCDATVARKMANSRLKAYGNILAKVGTGAVLGALSGGAEGALAGGAAGLLLSAGDMKNIKSLNKNLKGYKTTLAAYQKTFTEEGLPIDATVDLSNVDGIDFTKAEEITKSTDEIKKELADSKEAGQSLEDIDIEA